MEGDVIADLAERRPEVIRRLLERGVAPATLETLLPGWEPVFRAALREVAPAS